MESELLKKYNQAVPRYTSYPPANHFTSDFGEGDYKTLIAQSNTCDPQNIAVYVHIPFCKQICYYCGCNALKLHKDSHIEEYITALKQEIQLVLDQVDKTRRISQIHFGGGTPNAIESSFLKDIIATISQDFDFIESPEIAIECHPGLLSYDYLDELIDAGFNRFSLGIQDFDNEVLKAVNRQPAALPVESIVKHIRTQLPQAGINLDFIYGLPLQSPEQFAQSIKKAISIKPDRLVTFSYAHVPWLKKHQQILQEKGLPDTESKMAIFDQAKALLFDAGYQLIGFDHFAKPNDELSMALKNKALHRNFQGYCTRRTTGQVYAFGVSAISQLNDGYIQNTKSISTYIESIKQRQLPVEKGLTLTLEQKYVREVINQLMCNQYIHWLSMAQALSITMDRLKDIVQYNTEALTQMANDGLLSFDESHLETTEQGKTLIRNIAVLFDPMYKATDQLYSKTV